MTQKYEKSSEVPSYVIADRLYALALAITEGRDAVAREFTMRVPAELDRDADVVLAEAAHRLRRQDVNVTYLDNVLTANKCYREALTAIANSYPTTDEGETLASMAREALEP